jgi:para-nitrobenzyl esterase
VSGAVVVETAAGTLAAMRSGDALAFYGVPYGADTAGPARFRPPAPAPPWTGIRDAARFGPACLPTLTEHDRAHFARSPLWREYAGLDLVTGFSEDCLSLNVWTRELDGSRPVIVWLHGGGFSWGSGASTWTNGDALAARHDVVVVTVNHRLGVLGYLHMEDLAGEEWAGSGVAGLLDLCLALEWVRDNIRAFGGDPARVTIAGHSGGGAKVQALLALPAARGLFHRAILQSDVVSLRSVDRAEATVAARGVLAATGTDPAQVDRLRALPPERLTRLAAPFRFRPVVDGRWLPDHPFDPVAAPSASEVPLLIGTTTHDTATFKFDAEPGYGELDWDGLRARIAGHPSANLGDLADEVIAYFADERPQATPAELLVDITTALLRQRALLLVHRKLAGGPAPVYMYVFAFEAPMPAETPFAGASMSSHGLEVPFVFDIAERVEMTGSRPERLGLAAMIADYWSAFARDGIPYGPYRPAWPRYDEEARATMILDTVTRVEHDPYSAERELFERLLDTTDRASFTAVMPRV